MQLSFGPIPGSSVGNERTFAKVEVEADKPPIESPLFSCTDAEITQRANTDRRS